MLPGLLASSPSPAHLLGDGGDGGNPHAEPLLARRRRPAVLFPRRRLLGGRVGSTAGLLVTDIGELDASGGGHVTSHPGGC